MLNMVTECRYELQRQGKPEEEYTNYVPEFHKIVADSAVANWSAVRIAFQPNLAPEEAARCPLRNAEGEIIETECLFHCEQVINIVLNV